MVRYSNSSTTSVYSSSLLLDTVSIVGRMSLARPELLDDGSFEQVQYGVQQQGWHGTIYAGSVLL
jgi:hypothetical protein